MLFSSNKAAFNKLWKSVEDRDWQTVCTVIGSEDGDQRHVLLHQKHQAHVAHNQNNNMHRKRYCTQASCRMPLISWAIWNEAPLFVINAFILADSSALNALDSLGRSPLHIACICHSSSVMVDLLVEREPRSVFNQDRLGNCALHYAVTSACAEDAESLSERLEVITALVIYYPETTVIRNYGIETPIDVARRCDSHSPKRRIYHMLRNISIALKDDSTSSDDYTQQMASSDFMDVSGSFLFTGSNGKVVATGYAECAASGERPQRRNASSNVIADMQAAKHGGGCSSSRRLLSLRC
jgi:ankyrin repeat protein